MLSKRIKGAKSAREGWNLANAVGDFGPYGVFSTTGQDGTPAGLFFKPDGTKMYVAGDSNNSVYEYNLSTAWEISTASFVRSLSIAAQVLAPAGLFFRDDGLKMYVLNDSGLNGVAEYTLSTAWDISTASYVQFFSTAAQEATPLDVYFKPDGTAMYIAGWDTDGILEYSLSTAWNVSTASYVRVFVPGSPSNLQGVFFKEDGTRMYVLAFSGNSAYEYTLSTAWNVSTATFTGSFNLANQSYVSSYALYLKPDGTKMYFIGGGEDRVLAYSLSTPWSVSSASWDAPTRNYFNVAAQDTAPTGIFVKPDGAKMYVVGQTGDEVNEYNLSTAWDVSTASFVQVLSVAAQETAPSGIFFKPDGLRMFIMGQTGDDVNEYVLSTAWNVSTASFLRVLSVAAQEINPWGLSFSSDGSLMYVLGATGDDISVYSLSSPWSLFAGTYSNFFSVAVQDNNPRALFFKPDGLKMYVLGGAGIDVNEYSLTTPWNVSSASYVRNFSVATQESAPTGLFFKDDGTKMYVTGTNSDAIWVYNL